MDKKKNGNIFKSNTYSISTAFDEKYNMIIKAAEAIHPMKKLKDNNKN